MPSTTSRFWCFTLHPKSLDDGSKQTIPSTLPPKARYCVYQLEKGKDGKEHYQGYIEFNEAVSGGQRTEWVKTFIPGGHTEIKYAKREDARHYCMKPCSTLCNQSHCSEARSIGNGRVDWENTAPTELGSYGDITPGSRTDITELQDAIKKGATYEQICDLNFGFAMAHSRSLKDYIALYQPKRDWKTKVVVIYGDSGTGKSRYCRETYPNAYWLSKSSSGNVWWNGYNGQETVVIDDFYGWIPFDYMLHLMDRYCMSGETKGGVVNIIPKTLVITSNKPPCKWYSKAYENDLQLEIAFSRRIDEIQYWYYFLKSKQVVKQPISWRQCGGFVDSYDSRSYDSIPSDSIPHISEAEGVPSGGGECGHLAQPVVA